MKKLIIILLLSVFSVQLFSQVVKLTDGKPAWIPSYLILDGGLYFRNSGIYTSFGDSLDYYINKSDSISFYYTQRQVDSAITTGSVSFGTQYQVPYMNAAGTDHLYSSNFKWNDTTLNISQGTGNIFIGDHAGVAVTSGQTNTFTGWYSGYKNTTGIGNTLYGNSSGGSITSGSYNTFLGLGSGSSIVTGMRNILIGYNVGDATDFDDKLYIENSNSATPLIYGDFANDTVRINGTLDVTNTISGKGIIQVAKAEVLFSNTVQTTIITLPADAVIWDIGFEITVLFDDTGTDIINVGITGETDRYIDNANGYASAVRFEKAYGGLGMASADKMSGLTNITFQYTGQNVDATQGQAFIYIHYTTF